MITKGEYLKKLTANVNVRSVEIGKEMQGSTPPSVFIGSWNYPKVFAGPMIAPEHGDIAIMDRPESWIPGRKTQEEIIRYRLSLVRGKQPVRIADLSNRLVLKLRDIALAKSSVESTAQFESIPRGTSFSEDHSPFGPSATIEKFDIGNTRWHPGLEKAYYDGDLKAADAVMDLHNKGVSFSVIQKAFSVGSFGTSKRRKLVPTRWSITACDSAIGNRLLEEVRLNPSIDCPQVYEFSSLNNYYTVLLLPGLWQYEWSEAFLHVMGSEELIFSDYERNSGKKGYSTVGGCYYTCKMAVLEALAKQKRQAEAIVLREAYNGYVPLGVFNVRENVRNALNQPAAEFGDIKSALSHVSTRLQLPLSRFVKESALLKENLGKGQTRLSAFMG